MILPRYTQRLRAALVVFVPAMVVSDKSYLFVTGNSFSLRPPSFNSPHRCASSSSFSSDLVISPLLRWEYSVDAQSIVVPCGVRTANVDRTTRADACEANGERVGGGLTRRRDRTPVVPRATASSSDVGNADRHRRFDDRRTWTGMNANRPTTTRADRYCDRQVSGRAERLVQPRTTPNTRIERIRDR